MQRHKNNDLDIRKSLFPMEITSIFGTLMAVITALLLLLSQQIPVAEAAFGDPCETKGMPGVCRSWGDCPIIKTLIERREYTNREVVSCGFGVREELICCPVIRTITKIDDTTASPIIESTTTASSAHKIDFLQEVLNSLNSTTTTTTTTTTTQKPDFWLDFLTTTTTTTTTTMRPLIIGDQRLNESSEFFDFSQLLNQNRGNKLKQSESSGSSSNVQENSGSTTNTGNQNTGRNIDNGPVNVNPWLSNTFNNQPSQPQLGPQNNGGETFNGGGRGNNFSNNQPPNNGFIRNNNNDRGDWAQGNGRPNNNRQRNRGNGRSGNRNPGFVNNWNDQVAFPDKRENLRAPASNVDELMSNIFNAPREHFEPNPHNNQPTIFWFNNEEQQPHEQVEFVDPDQLGSATSNQFAAHLPIIEHHEADSDLESAPSTIVFVEEVAPAHNWQPGTVVQPTTAAQTFNPVQTVYENLLNSGMNIIKAKAEKVDRIFHSGQAQPSQPQQPQIGRQPNQWSQFGRQQFQQQQPPHVGQQPSQWQQSQFGQNSNQQSAQQTPQFGRQPSVQQPQFGRQPSQQEQLPQPRQQPTFGRQQSEQQPAQPSPTGRSPGQAKSPLSFDQGTSNSLQTPSAQSPSAQLLDPFKPFEFRPPPEDEQDDNSLRTPTPSPPPIDPNDRPAVRACRRIQNGLIAGLTPHILGGIPSELGEFPHMAAIGYGRLGDDGQGPYDIRCGGTLIDASFVLTAAHCVAARDSIPAIVRLGVVNFTDPNEMREAVEVRIKEIHIHNEYSQRSTYNDIAILELERPVSFSQYIYPVCLYTDEADPKPEVRLWVTGWGTVNTSTRAYSDILLKAPLHVTPLERCNDSFVDYGLTRQIDQGIIKTQLCAEDKDQLKDACQGDSGGPLNLIVDESYKNYRLVGVVSSGFGCASSTPGLYTRVAAFLDYIEQIVWPNGGD